MAWSQLWRSSCTWRARCACPSTLVTTVNNCYLVMMEISMICYILAMNMLTWHAFYLLFCFANHRSLLCHQCTSDNRGRQSGITTMMRTTYSNNDMTNSTTRKETTASTIATTILQWQFWVSSSVLPSSAYFRSANLLLVLLNRDKCCQTALSNTTYHAYHDQAHLKHAQPNHPHCYLAFSSVQPNRLNGASKSGPEKVHYSISSYQYL